MRSTSNLKPHTVPLYMFVEAAGGQDLAPAQGSPFEDDSFCAEKHPFAVLLRNPNDATTRHFDILWLVKAGDTTHTYATDKRKLYFRCEHVRGDGKCALRVAAAFSHEYGLINEDVSPEQDDEGEDTSVEDSTVSLEVLGVLSLCGPYGRVLAVIHALPMQ